ncbi:hypothetical protein GCM10010527_64930 [Streptomyces drozdowiczii]
MHGKLKIDCTESTLEWYPKGKPHAVAVTAVARELLGFIWAIGCTAEQHDNKTISTIA